MGDAELRVVCGLHEDGLQVRQDEAVDGARVDVALHDDAAPGVRERQAGHMRALRCSVHEEPRARRSPCFRRQSLRPVQRGRLGAYVDAVGAGGHVEGQRGSQMVAKDLARGEPALVAGDVVTARLTGRVAGKRIQVRASRGRLADPRRWAASALAGLEGS